MQYTPSGINRIYTLWGIVLKETVACVDRIDRQVMAHPLTDGRFNNGRQS